MDRKIVTVKNQEPAGWRDNRLVKWAQPRLADRVGFLNRVSNVGGLIFVATLFLAAALEDSFLEPRGLEWIVQLILLGSAVVTSCAIGLTSVATLPTSMESPSIRLSQIRTSLSELETTLHNLVGEVELMGHTAREHEEQLKRTQELIGLTSGEKEALFSELDRRDRSSTRQNVLLFVAGIAAGILTNLFVR